MKWIFERLKEEHDIELKMCNLGGGFPANYISRTNPLETYAEEITRFLKDDFGDDLPEIITCTVRTEYPLNHRSARQ